MLTVHQNERLSFCVAPFRIPISDLNKEKSQDREANKEIERWYDTITHANPAQDVYNTTIDDNTGDVINTNVSAKTVDLNSQTSNRIPYSIGLDEEQNLRPSSKPFKASF